MYKLLALLYQTQYKNEPIVNYCICCINILNYFMRILIYFTPHLKQQLKSRTLLTEGRRITTCKISDDKFKAERAVMFPDIFTDIRNV